MIKTFRFLRNLDPVRGRQKMSTSPQILKEVFVKSVQAVDPAGLLRSEIQVSRNESHLIIRGETIALQKPCFIVGFGKAVLGMAREAETLLGDLLNRGVVTIPEGLLTGKNPIPVGSRIRYIEGARNNIPDEKAMAGALQIRELLDELGHGDVLLVLISGGGSALLPLPVPPITLDEKQSLIRRLSTAGADIRELNCVRKKISLLKGGGLAELAFPARVISLILSDIVGDPLDFIASGPTTPNLDKPERALEIVRKYTSDYDSLIPAAIKTVLEEVPGVEKPREFAHVQNRIIGNNKIAAEAAKTHLQRLGFQSAVISTSLTGDVGEIADFYASLASVISCPSVTSCQVRRFLRARQFVDDEAVEAIASLDFGQDVCLVGAGEPTVAVRGGGRGGRNQQLALEFSVRLNKLQPEMADISFLSAGTDGIDGPTDAAGAIGTLDLVHNCLLENIKPEDYLENNDSYGFYSAYKNGQFLIKIGHTGTNVMDIHLLLKRTGQGSSATTKN